MGTAALRPDRDPLRGDPGMKGHESIECTAKPGLGGPRFGTLRAQGTDPVGGRLLAAHKDPMSIPCMQDRQPSREVREVRALR